MEKHQSIGVVILTLVLVLVQTAVAFHIKIIVEVSTLLVTSMGLLGVLGILFLMIPALLTVLPFYFLASFVEKILSTFKKEYITNTYVVVALIIAGYGVSWIVYNVFFSDFLDILQNNMLTNTIWTIVLFTLHYTTNVWLRKRAAKRT